MKAYNVLNEMYSQLKRNEEIEEIDFIQKNNNSIKLRLKIRFYLKLFYWANLARQLEIIINNL